MSHIQLNAPGTSDLLNAPVLAPASGPLPAGIVSLQAKNGGDYAQQAARLNEQLANAQAAPQTTIPVRAGLPSPSSTHTPGSTVLLSHKRPFPWELTPYYLLEIESRAPAASSCSSVD